MRKRIGLISALLAAAIGLSACGAAQSLTSTINSADGRSYSAGASAEIAEESYAMQDSGLSNGQTVLAPQSDRKIVYNADLTLESRDYDGTRQAISEALSAAGGYMESSSEGGSAEQGDRWVNYTLRVPADQYADFLTAAGESGSLTQKSEYTEDITSQYVDVEARLAALEAQRDRLNELADQAETTSDLLEIESQLSEVQYQIESYTAQQRSYDDVVDYATVYIYLSEVQVYSPTTVSFVDRVVNAAESGWQNFVVFLQDVIVVLVALWPMVLIGVVIVVVVCVTARARRAKRAARMAAQQAARAAAQPATYAPPASPAAPKDPNAPKPDSAPAQPLYAPRQEPKE